MTKFSDLDIPEPLLNSLNVNNFINPTEIQEKTIPLGLQGKDIIGSAQTGTGKTLAFLIPTIKNLLENKDHKAIIIEPTRELAQQVLDVAISLCKHGLGIRSTLLIGGESHTQQIKNLKNNTRIIIGTPGRIIDHLEKKTLDLSDCHTLILDETDRMFDMGFYIQLESILKYIPSERQTLMFSATFPKEVEEMAAKQLKNPERVFVQPPQDPNALSKDLIQTTVNVKEEEKYDELLKQINEREGSIIVFVKTKKGVDALSRKLLRDKIRCCSIHGDLHQRTREKIIDKFRNKKSRILIGTDVVARGLDIPHIMHVINYDVPLAPEDYVHRVGRTARNGASGCAVTFLTPNDDKSWDAIQCLLDPTRKSKFHGAKKRFVDRRGFNKFGNRINKFGNNKFKSRGSFSGKRGFGRKQKSFKKDR
jgi:superfamily II DNA/RNA helicase